LTDPRLTRLAEGLISHSTSLKKGEHLLIETFDVPDAISIELVRAAKAVGAHPHVTLRSQRILRALIDGSDDAQFTTWGAYDAQRMEKMDAYIAIRGAHNVSELAGVSAERMQAFDRLYRNPVHFQQRIKHTKWCVLRWPNPSMAQLAQVDSASFEDFYFNVCTLDYGRMADAVKPLKERMERTDEVRLTGPGETNLTFSIKGIPAVPCTGSHNIPDGECFTAPVRDSVNGVIHYNTPTLYRGITFENIRLTFRNGQIVEATADQNAEHLDGIFDTDEGARYVGEFAIGFNPYIERAMKDILFDEKIAGSIHFTPGRAYDDADNGNRSEIHWDLVLIQRPEAGGGTMHFDGELVRQDGLFVVDELAGLNPDALSA